MTSQDHVAWYPGTGQQYTVENLVLLLALKKLSQTPEGMKTLEKIAIKYLESCASVVESVENACHSNWLTALNNQHIALGICHKLGLVGDHSYIKTMEHYRAVFDKMLQKGYVVEGLSTLTNVITKTQTSAPEKAVPGKGLSALADILGITGAGKASTAEALR
jgi:hypothetical protein